MKIKVLWLYYDIMDLYGDKGNILTLKYRCKKRNIDFILDSKTIGDNIEFSEYDLVFIGGGADKEQRLLSKDLVSRKDNIKKSIEKGTKYLLICGSYQLFGKYYIDANNNKISGLEIYDYYTETSPIGKRCIGNILIEVNLDGEKIEVIGFENHGGQTKGVKYAFGKVIIGNGNEFHSKYEGFYDGKVLGTYIHGPLLPKNPELTDFLIKKSLERSYGNIDLDKLDDDIEKKAFEIIRSRMKKNVKRSIQDKGFKKTRN